MGDIWNKMNEEMSKPRFSGYDIAGAVVPPVAAAQGAMSAYKKYKSKKTGLSTYARQFGVADSLVEESQRSRARRKVGQNDKPNAKINLRKEYKD